VLLQDQSVAAPGSADFQRLAQPSSAVPVSLPQGRRAPHSDATDSVASPVNTRQSGQSAR